MPVTYSYRLDQLVKERKFVPYRLNKNADYEVGKTYWCGYWQKWYKVLEVKDNPRSYNGIKIEWEDGKIAEHGTSLDTRRDYELRPFEFDFDLERTPVNDDTCSLTAAEIRALCCEGSIGLVIYDDLKAKYFENKKYKPNDYTYYWVNSEMDWDRGIRITNLTRDLNKSPRKKRSTYNRLFNISTYAKDVIHNSGIEYKITNEEFGFFDLVFRTDEDKEKAADLIRFID